MLSNYSCLEKLHVTKISMSHRVPFCKLQQSIYFTLYGKPWWIVINLHKNKIKRLLKTEKARLSLEPYLTWSIFYSFCLSLMDTILTNCRPFFSFYTPWNSVTRKQSMPNFPKNEHFLPPDMHTHVCFVFL